MRKTQVNQLHSNPCNLGTQEKPISEIAYQKYKWNWLKQRNYSKKLINKTAQEWLDLRQEFKEESQPFCDFIDEHGFHGECYVCFEEFLENEYQSTEFMYSLLSPSEYERYRQERQETDCIKQNVTCCLKLK